jgi:hypothetical protein
MKTNSPLRFSLSLFLSILLVIPVVIFVFTDCSRDIVQDRVSLRNWEEDIEFFRKKLPELHINPFTIITEEQFNTGVDSLYKNLSYLSDYEVKIELMKILASIGDQHTRLHIKNSFAPVVISSFDDGFYVVGGQDEFKDYLGWEIIEVDGIPISKCAKILSLLTATKRKEIQNIWISLYLMHPEILHGSRILNNVYDYVVTLEKNGIKKAITDNFYEGTFDTEYLTVDNLIRFKNNSTYSFSLENINSTSVLYFDYLKCISDDEYPISEIVSDVIEALDENRVDKLIIDLSKNRGGSSGLLSQLIDYLKDSYINEYGKIFVITGYETFSSAVLDVGSLQNEINSIIIGAPAGDNLNHFGEVGTFFLPHNTLNILISTKKMDNQLKRGNPDDDALYPDIRIPYNFKDIYDDGRDLVLEKIMNITDEEIEKIMEMNSY